MNGKTKSVISAIAAVILVIIVFALWKPEVFTEDDPYTYIPENAVEAEPAVEEEPVVEAEPAVEEGPVAEAEPAVEEEQVGESSLRFRNEKLLMQHFEKHGRDMGFASAKEYEEAAVRVPNNPAALHKTEKEDGDDVYYIEATNEFVVVSTDGYIRTYFLPDSGIKYYNKQ